MSKREILGRWMGHVQDELRSHRGLLVSIDASLKELIKQNGGHHAKLDGAIEDVGQLQERNRDHERRLADIERRRPA